MIVKLNGPEAAGLVLGSNFTFEPDLTPKQMLEMGVFGGWYFEGEYDEFPAAWFKNAALSKDDFQEDLNRFSVAAGQPRSVWCAKGWITPEDPLGWFQWYCRYTMGRRLADVDALQIRRQQAFGARHIPQVMRNCEPGNVDCRPRQRQALLQWAYDPYI